MVRILFLITFLSGVTTSPLPANAEQRADSAAEAAAHSLPADRDTPYSGVCYNLRPDETYMRQLIGSLDELGATRAHTLIYWWMHEKLEGDWWKGKYPESMFGDNYLKQLDLFVDLCTEMGIRPSLRIGNFDRTTGLWHPGDPSGDIANYAQWVGMIAARYRGKIDHYVIGDELNRGIGPWYKGRPEQYLETFFIPMSKVIRENDPDAAISTCSTGISEWQLELIELGLPQYADGIGFNIWRLQLEDRAYLQKFIDQAQALWPEVKFYSNGVGYIERESLDDPMQAARVAQMMFDLWDMGWDSAPIYVYRFAITADTKQDLGIIGIPSDGSTTSPSAGWYAYQTIAHTFYNRDQMTEPDFKIALEPAQNLPVADGSTIQLSPPDVFVRSFVRGDELLLYLTYHKTRQPRRGTWNVVIESDQWGSPQVLSMQDYRQRTDMGTDQRHGALVVEDVEVSTLPTVLTLRRKSVSDQP